MGMSYSKLTIMALYSFSFCVIAEEATSYVHTESPFVEIRDSQKQAQEWARCAAVYDIVAELLRSDSPNRANELHQKANGAGAAITMTLFSKAIDDLVEDDPEASRRKINATIKFAKMASKEWPAVQMTSMLADLEADPDIVARRLTKSMKVCQDNLISQQAYIDMYRELVMSGVFSPGE
jgi:hypothetical protein